MEWNAREQVIYSLIKVKKHCRDYIYEIPPNTMDHPQEMLKTLIEICELILSDLDRYLSARDFSSWLATFNILQ